MCSRGSVEGGPPDRVKWVVVMCRGPSLFHQASQKKLINTIKPLDNQGGQKNNTQPFSLGEI